MKGQTRATLKQKMMPIKNEQFQKHDLLHNEDIALHTGIRL